MGREKSKRRGKKASPKAGVLKDLPARRLAGDTTKAVKGGGIETSPSARGFRWDR